MNPDDAVDLSIRNRRPDRLTRWLVGAGLAGVWSVLILAHRAGLLDWLPADFGIIVCIVGIMSCGVLAFLLTLDPARHWKLGEKLVVWPGREYTVGDVREITFGPDPAEDYDDAVAPARGCEVRARLRRGELRLIASAGDARRVRDWAVRQGIAVTDLAGVLEQAPHEP
jgi:hypothetical protein